MEQHYDTESSVCLLRPIDPQQKPFPFPGIREISRTVHVVFLSHSLTSNHFHSSCPGKLIPTVQVVFSVKSTTESTRPSDLEEISPSWTLLISSSSERKVNVQPYTQADWNFRFGTVSCYDWQVWSNQHKQQQYCHLVSKYEEIIVNKTIKSQQGSVGIWIIYCKRSKGFFKDSYEILTLVS